MIKALTRNLHYVFKSLAFITQLGQSFFEAAFLFSGPPRQIFGRQGRHSGGHFTGALPLPPPFSISQNPAKDQALAALPPVAVPIFTINFTRTSRFPQILVTLGMRKHIHQQGQRTINCRAQLLCQHNFLLDQLEMRKNCYDNHN